MRISDILEDTPAFNGRQQQIEKDGEALHWASQPARIKKPVPVAEYLSFAWRALEVAILLGFGAKIGVWLIARFGRQVAGFLDHYAFASVVVAGFVVAFVVWRWDVRCRGGQG